MSVNNASEMTETRKAQLCSEWLQYCEDIGWVPKDLPLLEDLFWQQEGWKTFKGYPSL